MFTVIWTLISVFIPIFPIWLNIIIGVLLLAIDFLVIWRIIK